MDEAVLKDTNSSGILGVTINRCEAVLSTSKKQSLKLTSDQTNDFRKSIFENQVIGLEYVK